MACYLVKPHGCLWCPKHGVVRGRGSFRQGCGSPWGRAWHGNGRTAAWIGEIKGTREATHRRPLCVLHCMAHVLQAVEYHTVLENITYTLKKISFPNCGLQHDSHFVNASMCQYWKLYGWGYSKHLINMVKHYILKLQLMMCNIPLATWWQGCTMTGHSTQIPHPWNLRPGKKRNTNITDHLAHFCYYFNGIEQDGSISSALAIEILQSCTKPSIYCYMP